LLKEATREAQGLYGREPNLDAFLRKARKGPIPPEELTRFRELLSELPML
jgi:hypothetical protein